METGRETSFEMQTRPDQSRKEGTRRVRIQRRSSANGEQRTFRTGLEPNLTAERQIAGSEAHQHHPLGSVVLCPSSEEGTQNMTSQVG